MLTVWIGGNILATGAPLSTAARTEATTSLHSGRSGSDRSPGGAENNLVVTSHGKREGVSYLPFLAAGVALTMVTMAVAPMELAMVGRTLLWLVSSQWVNTLASVARLDILKRKNI